MPYQQIRRLQGGIKAAMGRRGYEKVLAVLVDHWVATSQMGLWGLLYIMNLPTHTGH